METSAGARTCIVILGMHRSGTSALARIVALLGAELPIHLLGANSSNTGGHWEPEPLIQINDRVLGEFGQTWDDWRPLTIGQIAKARVRGYRREIESCLREEYRHADVMVLKEPRISRLLWLYHPVFEALQWQPLYILCTRSPGAVAASLAVRNGIEPSHADLLWLRYVLDAELATRNARRALLSYEVLLADWRSAMKSVTAALEFNWKRPFEDVTDSIGAFLKVDLNHWEGREVPLDADSLTGGVYGALLGLERDPGDVTARELIDAFSETFDASARLLGTTMLGLQRQAEELRHVVEEEQTRASSLERALAAVIASRSWRVTSPLRSAKDWIMSFRASGPQ